MIITVTFKNLLKGTAGDVTIDLNRSIDSLVQKPGEAVSLLPYSNLDVFRHENVAVIPLQEPSGPPSIAAVMRASFRWSRTCKSSRI